jgi:hypothetical protein
MEGLTELSVLRLALCACSNMLSHLTLISHIKNKEMIGSPKALSLMQPHGITVLTENL